MYTENNVLSNIEFIENTLMGTSIMHIVNKFCLCPMQWGFTEQCWIVWDLTLDYMRLLDYEVTLVILLYGDYTS